MSKTSETILREALELNDSERAEIAAVLIESLDAMVDQDVDEAWRAEIRHRMKLRKAGKMEVVPWEEVRAEINARLNESQ
jgi:putative addiction module component (TIGR02574 family)